MIKWKVLWEEYNKSKKKWTEEVSPRLFNLIFVHCTQDFRAVLQGRTEWPAILDDQDGVALVKLLHALHHQQDEPKPEMWEIVQQDQAFLLCTQKQNQSDVEFGRALQGTADAINEAGGNAGLTPRSLKLVCREQQIDWDAIPDTAAGRAKQIELQTEASRRYIACACLTALDGRRHAAVKRHIKNAFATEGNDILPRSMPDLLKLLQVFVEPTVPNTTTRRDPNHPGVAMVEAADKRSPGGGADANKVGDDMTGITNKQGRSGCDHCGAANHWMATCPHKGKTADELQVIRAKNSASPQLVEVADMASKKKEEEPEEVWGEEGVACVSPAAGFETPKLDSHKLYLNSCASHTQVYHGERLTNLYKTQMGLHTISNGGASTACEYGYILGTIESWLVRTGIANLLSIPAIEKKGFRVQSDTCADWVITSPGGTRIVFKRDTGRCDRFPYVDLRDPEIV